MVRFITFLYAFIYLHSVYATTTDHFNHNFSKMTCNELMVGLIKESSLHEKFHDPRLGLVFGFERRDNSHIGIVFMHTAGKNEGIIYGNFILNLNKGRLQFIDYDHPIPIKINQNYIPYIATKCTPDKNIYLKIGRGPFKEDME